MAVVSTFRDLKIDDILLKRNEKQNEEEMQCILPQSPTTPERFLSNPYYGKGFCEPDQYKVAINRCEDGFAFCELALEMLKDLVNELQRCSESLRKWSDRSQNKITLSKEFKTNRIEVQKPWVEVLNKISEAKLAYHRTSGKLHRARRAEDITSCDVSTTDEEKKKEKRKNIYEKLINDMESKRSAYQVEMFKILGRADDFERKRLEHFKLTFTALQQATSIENDARRTEMFEKFQRAISKHNADSDIEVFNKNYGCETRTKWPVFEDVEQ
ncbi:unnamed protein product [Rotaria magnacalcarata]|uniref:Uncharacterized protein n=1 Tax=Rotaria magnacalcarata TaxID=392030 RepID=A0A816RXN4_9BILA|nr:unnamed protein product [Rotaria magnacalcarata]